MYTCQIVTDSNACVGFGTIFCSPPEYDKWWGWDLNFGSPYYTISMRQHRGDKPEYMLWRSYNNTTLNTAQVLFRSGEIPFKYLFFMMISNWIPTHWTRWGFRVPLINAFKMKRV